MLKWSWCRVLLEESVAEMAKCVQQAVLIAKTKGGALEGRLPDEDTLLRQTMQCICSCRALVQLTKQHDHRQPILASALKHGCKCLDLFMKASRCFLPVHNVGFLYYRHDSISKTAKWRVLIECGPSFQSMNNCNLSIQPL